MRPDARETGAYPPIADYAALGDCRTIALVSRHGSIDWLCLPHPSAPSFFGALLDRYRGGRFCVCPSGLRHVERAYLDGTNVLQTIFRCERGTLRLTDFVAMEHAEPLHPQHQLVRLLECVDGEVQVQIDFQPRPGYGARTPRLVERGRLGWMCASGGLASFLQSDCELQPQGEAALSGAPRMRSGETRQLVFTTCRHDAGVLVPLGNAPRRSLERTVAWWRSWLAQCTYEGPYRGQVMRSALTLKLLTYSLSGAVVAAATTSLPTDATGAGNWDYRYCWLRDSAMVLQAFMDLGLQDESRAFLGWLLHATARTQPRLQVVYDIHGRTRLRERALDHLARLRGFEG